MKLHILSNSRAERYIPVAPTYWLSIVSSDDTFSWMGFEKDKWEGRQKLITFDHYDSNHSYERRTIFFSKKHAKDILEDFEKHKNSIDELIISCEQGKNRSSGVALALNDAYQLGVDSQELVKKFPNYARDVYQILFTYAVNEHFVQ